MTKWLPLAPITDRPGSTQFLQYLAAQERAIAAAGTGGGGSATWGGITGTLSAQVDLQGALTLRVLNYATRAAFVSANTATPGLGLSDGQVVTAGGIEYRRLAASTAISGLSGWVPNGTATPQHFGAIADGVTDARPAFVSANTLGGNVSVDGHFSLSSAYTITAATPQLSPSLTWSDMTDDNDLDWSFGMFRDDGFLPIQRFAGRTFFGEATRHSGNRQGVNNYGDDAVSQSIASWTIKNAQVAAMSSDVGGRIGITGAAWIQPGAAGSIGAGVLGIARNDGISGSARGGYFEVIAAKTAGTTAADIAAEFQVGNRTSTAPVVSSYDMGGSIVNGMQISVESQMGYTTGNSDTAYTAPTQPAGAAVDVSGGSLGAAYQKWTAGLVFRNGALVRDGSDFADAVVLAQKHRFVWEVSASVEGASIWSEVTAGTSRMAQAFRDNEVTFYGPTGQTIAAIRHDTAGAGTVNNPVLRSARTNVPVALIGEGSDANVSVDVQAKGAGVVRLMSHGGTGEHLRVLGTNVGTDFVTVVGSAGLGSATIGTGGASTNIDLVLSPKGTGLLRYGSFTSAVNGPVTGYIEIKDSGGTTRRLGVVTGVPGSGGGTLSGVATVTVPNNRFEWEETVTATGVTAASRIFLTVASHVDADENDAEMLDIAAMSAAPGTDVITLKIAFPTPAAGPIKINWMAA